MMMTFKCSNHFKIVFDHLRLSFNAVNMVFFSKNCVKYTKLLVQKCAFMHVFQKRSGYVLIEACALIRTNTAFQKHLYETS